MGKVELCLRCEEEVYAKYLCRSHYANHRRKANKRAKAIERVKAMAELEGQLQLIGISCPIATCETLIFPDEDLCSVHGNRAKNWQFTRDQLITAFNPAECEMCEETDVKLVLDHEHGLPCENTHIGSSGCPECFRGLLCHVCNTGLGLFEAARFRARAEIYLESHRGLSGERAHERREHNDRL